MLHRRHEAGAGRTSASGFVFMAEHSGTHIDALSHQAWQMEMFGNVTVTPEVQRSDGFTELGIETVGPIVRPGKLLDVAGALNTEQLDLGVAVSDTDLASACGASGVEITEGDVVLIRTGNGARWDQPEAYEKGPGINRSAAEWLADRDVFAVGADNLALDVIGTEDPDLGPLPAHTVLIIRNGIFIIENLYLEDLAEAAISEFLFVCVPLKMRGVTASPVRPLALVPKTAGQHRNQEHR